MRKIVALTLFLFAPTLFANTIQFSSPEETNLVITLEYIETLPITSYVTELPWLESPAVFEGVTLSTLLRQAFGEVPKRVELRALNDYHANLNREDILRYEPIVAYKKDNKYIQIRDKGPFWLIYPISRFPEIDVSHYHSQMVWQLNSVKIEEK
ncbi:oxidoreductase [Vibrio rotiferianus]|uniref:oxidoreductase n=1 Tax=Vibrio rotiferianus TaxID=190895 RepID=UPI00339AC83A